MTQGTWESSRFLAPGVLERPANSRGQQVPETPTNARGWPTGGHHALSEGGGGGRESWPVVWASPPGGLVCIQLDSE